MAERSAHPGRGTPLRGLIGWALFDWANSPFTTLIITFVFGAYFSQGIVGDEIRGAELWGYAISASGLAVALLSPVFGAIADAGGRRKPWLLVFTAVCVVGSAMLWFAEPAPQFAALAMFWVIIANLGFEFGIVFNNAMLPDLVAPARLGRWSGWAWGLGYFGGLGALIAALFAFITTETPLFGLDKAAAEHLRVVGPLAAVWFALFTWPLFAYTPDRPPSGKGIGARVSQGLS
ncbi:MAG: MFS transporter, partial [Alphaproteobacteria bacterium]|nr:MFS transporter [Alphaproteobacteria bacterium]